MSDKFKDILKAIIALLYILMIGSMLVNNENFIYKEPYLLIVNIVLLCVGFYYFIQSNK